ncbi:hypothetical protein SODALDRAFT_320969 [Sodiomyces alkalinus F11]|uniref:Uncharacterized protein n=1 Tax=Sodiomyces alkalinus (strain CBS 110278 / VKM F-3762 / F11) TaxID=1314773 RepID=A0A3N2PK06_SODAK|nr:hypothetical protein SODALDRAFT_320969 [Sodiomyces alkalinus F11]ROT34855.1 hypothetical protein SODALDRAFT_320969 [Sodiomyces alkalinus F11]
MSPTASPQKQRQPASGELSTEGTAKAGACLGLEKPLNHQEKQESRTASITRRSGMLPTPVKTPKKPPTEAQAASIQAVARNLFSGDDDTARLQSARKKRVPKKYTGISMDSFKAEQVEEPIQIYTDSRDRVPEVDTSAENPFYGNNETARPEPRLRRSKRNVVVPGEGSQDIDEALEREDGMVFVFRGKRVFRKFDATDEDEEGAEGPRTLTRSSIKPRRLFQTAEKVTPEEEEALTDIEDHDDMEETEEEAPGTPDVEKCAPSTPSAPRFGPATPPDTRRTTRFGPRAGEATPSKSMPNSGPFFDWPRVKNRSSSEDRVPKRSADSNLTASDSKRSRAI